MKPFRDATTIAEAAAAFFEDTKPPAKSLDSLEATFYAGAHAHACVTKELLRQLVGRSDGSVAAALIAVDDEIRAFFVEIAARVGRTEH